MKRFMRALSIVLSAALILSALSYFAAAAENVPTVDVTDVPVLSEVTDAPAPAAISRQTDLQGSSVRAVTSEEELLAAISDESCDTIQMQGACFVELKNSVTLNKKLELLPQEGQEGFTCLKISENGSLTLGETGSLSAVPAYDAEGGLPIARATIVVDGGTLDLRKGEYAEYSNVTYMSGKIYYDGSTANYQFDYCVRSEQELLDALEDPICTFLLINADIELSKDLALDKSCMVIDGASLTIPEGVTLTVPADRYLIVDSGKLDVRGEITGEGNWTGKEEELPEGMVIVESFQDFQTALNDPDCKSILITGTTEIHVPDGANLIVGKPIYCVGNWEDGVLNKLFIEQNAAFTLSEGGELHTMGPDENGLSRIVVFGKLYAADGTVPDGTNFVFYPDDKAVIELPYESKVNIDYVVRTLPSLEQALDDIRCSTIIVENGVTLAIDYPITLTKDLYVNASHDENSEITRVAVLDKGRLTLAEGVTITTRNTFDDAGYPKGIAEIYVRGGVFDAQNGAIGEGSRIYFCPEYDPGLGGDIHLPENLNGTEVIFEVVSYNGLIAALEDPRCTDLAICEDFTLNDDLTLTKSAILDDGISVTVPEGVTLTVAQDVLLIYFSETNLNVQGTVTGDGWWPGKPETPAVRRGDVNGDDTLNAKDVTALRRHLAGGYGITINEKAADTNNDGEINAKDVTTLRRSLAGGYGVTLE